MISELFASYVMVFHTMFPLTTAVIRIIYPHTYIQFLSSKRNMEELMDILRIVHLAYLPGREGWGGVKEWGGVLSGGERQRVSDLLSLMTV